MKMLHGRAGFLMAAISKSPETHPNPPKGRELNMPRILPGRIELICLIMLIWPISPICLMSRIRPIHASATKHNKPPPFRMVGAGFPLATFRLPKGRLSHAKRPPFATRKTAFCKAIDYQRVTRQHHHAARTLCFQQRKGMKIMRNTQSEKRLSAVYPPPKN